MFNTKSKLSKRRLVFDIFHQVQSAVVYALDSKSYLSYFDSLHFKTNNNIEFFVGCKLHLYEDCKRKKIL